MLLLQHLNTYINITFQPAKEKIWRCETQEINCRNFTEIYNHIVIYTSRPEKVRVTTPTYICFSDSGIDNDPYCSVYMTIF